MLPGPPRELKPIFAALVDGPLAARAVSTRVLTRGIIVAGLSESHADERLQPLYEAWRHVAPPIEATILASAGQIELHLFARGERAFLYVAVGSPSEKSATRIYERLGFRFRCEMYVHVLVPDGTK